MNNQNLACRIFKEQIELIQQLPENERATVLYEAIMSSYNQIENQNENAYVSVSVSVLGNCIYNLLSRNIVWKNFSNNYGGKRNGAGRPKNNQDKIQNEKPSDKKPVRGSFVAPTLEEVLTYAKQMNDTAGMGGFVCSKQTAIDFFTHYDRQGWLIGNGNHMTKWQSGLRGWADEQRKKLLEQ